MSRTRCRSALSGNQGGKKSRIIPNAANVELGLGGQPQVLPHAMALSRINQQPSEDDPTVKVDEEATSWHHAMRLFVLGGMEDAPVFVRVSWFASSFLLIAVQCIVMFSFSGALSYKRCMADADCPKGRMCAARSFSPSVADPFDPQGIPLPRGVCFECVADLDAPTSGSCLPYACRASCRPLSEVGGSSLASAAARPLRSATRCLSCLTQCAPAMESSARGWSRTLHATAWSGASTPRAPQLSGARQLVPLLSPTRDASPIARPSALPPCQVQQRLSSALLRWIKSGL